ncbi:hypothetical protein H9P43_003871 [Blastocladiella emersonii ATCC 22665]|nr:hypothetical protein H9P43_003871 [Blastocladiella emersonii ATCC 22665]
MYLSSLASRSCRTVLLRQRGVFAPVALRGMATSTAAGAAPPSEQPPVIDINLSASLPAGTETAVVASAEPFGLSPVDLATLAFDAVHAASGWTWAPTILATTFALRAVLTLPLAVHGHRMARRMASLRPVARAWSSAIANETRRELRAAGAPFETFQAEYKKRYAAKLGELYAEHGVRPVFAALAPIAQIPVWVAASLALRRMSGTGAGEALVPWLQHVPAEWAAEAAGWWTSLAAVDPTWIGPVALGAMHLANVQLSLLPGVAGPPSSADKTKGDEVAAGWTRQTVVVNVMRGVGVLMVPIASTVPMGLVLYWLASAGFSLAQNVVLKLVLPRVAPVREDEL